MNIFTDTNILIDVIGKREGFFENAAKILKLGEEGIINLFISPLLLANSLYILKRHYDSAENNTTISTIITRNSQDFQHSSLLVQTPQEFLDTNNF